MKTLGCKVSDEMWDAFQNYCQSQGRNINEVLTSLIEQTLEGKIKPRPTGLESRALFCPECGYLAQLIQDDSEFYLWCLKCNWCAYIGRFTLPAKTQDWTKKIKEL